jgi:glycosyltransferase involved in cell wall biosynthesis
LRVVVNTRLLRKNQMDGIGWFAYNTLKNITQLHKDIEFHFLFDSGIDKDFLFSENVVPHNLFPPAKHAVLNIVWSEVSVKKILKRVNPDLYFSPDGILCLGWSGKQHTVIHDINFHHHPKDLKFSNRKYHERFFRKFANKATRIATVSEYSKKDISRSFEIDEGKIDVVYCGINSFYHPVDQNTIESTREKYSSGHPYFVFVGTISPRKNVLTLLKAFELFKKETELPSKLLIVGREMFRTKELAEYKKRMVFGNDVIFTGRLNDSELNEVLASAISLTFIPYFEGFGIPLIEAMECNVPIIASNVTSIPEVVGNAALMVDPLDIEQVKESMKKVSFDPILRRELVEAGKIRKELFSWERTSSLLWTSIEKAF